MREKCSGCGFGFEKRSLESIILGNCPYFSPNIFMVLPCFCLSIEVYIISFLKILTQNSSSEKKEKHIEAFIKSSLSYFFLE